MDRYPLLLIILLTLMACERELDIDYHTVEPLYVAEMELTDHHTTARITTTRPVMGTAASDYLVNDAIITIRSTQDSWADTLKWKSQGRYELSYFFGMEGMEYEADVIIGGKHHLSTSVMKGKPVINSFDFVWMDMMSEKILFADLHLHGEECRLRHVDAVRKSAQGLLVEDALPGAAYIHYHNARGAAGHDELALDDHRVGRDLHGIEETAVVLGACREPAKRIWSRC